MYRNNNEEVQDNSYNNPESNNLDYKEYPYLAYPYLRQYPRYLNPMMYPSDEYPVYGDMFRQHSRRYYHPYYHHSYHPYFHHSSFPWWLLFFL